ncbi:40S ribosomal protein S30-like [Pyrus ussuriensis x Pyrus communis]|uniref:40S ribosomal protein S30 n=1 Tax=Pyrus ussuriensis x Pyrus communis TaxID=2448454 RepID=A0A5N5FM56_9ROSA|nr:40S ribosomal protein S30-like [Pyrus ussuriensis x Pyrus communis]
MSMGKVHSWLLARVRKVRGQTPKVAKQDKKKPKGYVYKLVGFRKKKRPTC